MLRMILQNIRDFYDVTIFLTVLAIGVFSIAADYTYFKKVKYRKDAAVSLGIGIAYLILPFVLFLITRLSI